MVLLMEDNLETDGQTGGLLTELQRGSSRLYNQFVAWHEKNFSTNYCTGCLS